MIYGPHDFRRAIVDSEPAGNRQWAYTLECGHTVIRRQNAAKRYAICGTCQSGNNRLIVRAA